MDHINPHAGMGKQNNYNTEPSNSGLGDLVDGIATLIGYVVKGFFGTFKVLLYATGIGIALYLIYNFTQ